MYELFSGDQSTPNSATEIDTSCDETEAGLQDSDTEDTLSASLTDIVNVSTLVFTFDICLYRICSYPIIPGGVPAE